MSTPREFDRILRDRLGCRAAWLPVTSIVELGDYGVISDGVFHRIGNVTADFGIRTQTAEGAPARLNFTSETVRAVRYQGEAKVDAFHVDAAGAGRLELEFDRASAFVLKAGRIAMRQLQNIAAVATALGKAPGWRSLAYHVVHQVYAGSDIAFLSSRTAGTRVVLSGEVEALRRLDVDASFSSKLGVSADKEIGLSILGSSGPIGLNLFRVRHFSHAPVMRGSSAAAPIEYLSATDELEDSF